MAIVVTNLGQIKETIPITYRSLIRSLFMYAATIWYPNAKLSMIQKLQTVQNCGLRVATECVKITFMDHLHEETKVHPGHDHLSLTYVPNISTELLNLTTLPTMGSIVSKPPPRLSET